MKQRFPAARLSSLNALCLVGAPSRRIQDILSITLRHPVEWHEKRISELTIRRLVVADLLLMKQADGDVGRQVALISALSGQPPPLMRRLNREDFFALGEAVNAFLPSAP